MASAGKKLQIVQIWMQGVLMIDFLISSILFKSNECLLCFLKSISIISITDFILSYSFFSSSSNSSSKLFLNESWDSFLNYHASSCFTGNPIEEWLNCSFGGSCFETFFLNWSGSRWPSYYLEILNEEVLDF